MAAVMGGGARALVFLLAVILLQAAAARAAGLDGLCFAEFLTLRDCQPYGSGATNSVSIDCCTKAASLAIRKYVCLCYLIQEVFKGDNPTVESLNLQRDKILKLPVLCNLSTDGNFSECIPELKLSPNAPEISIFNGSGTYNSSGFALRPMSSFAIASAVLSAAVYSVFSL